MPINVLQALRQAMAEDNFLSKREFNEAISAPADSKELPVLSKAQLNDINKFFKEVINHPKWFLDVSVVKKLAQVKGISKENFDPVNDRSRAATAAWANLDQSAKADNHLSLSDWKRFEADATKFKFKDEVGLFAGASFALSFLKATNKERSDDQKIVVQEAVESLIAQRWDSKGKRLKPLSLISYFPEVLGQGDGCAEYLKFDFDKNDWCDGFGEGRDDYNVDGKISLEDDWLLLEHQIGHLGEKEKEIAEKAIKTWEGTNHPEKDRHLAYWRGERKLQLKHGLSLRQGTEHSANTNEGVIVLSFEKDFSSYKLKIKDGDIIKVVSGENYKSNQEIKITVPKKEKELKIYRVEIEGVQKKGKIDEVSFRYTNVAVWQVIRINDVKINLPENELTFYHNQEIPLKKVVVEFYKEDFNVKDKDKERKDILHRQVFNLSPEQGKGPRISLKWSQEDVPHNKVKSIKVTAFDPHDEGYRWYNARSVVPIKLKHAQVKFDNNSSELKSDEIKRNVHPVIQEIWRYQRAYSEQEFTLWVVGKTDRLGEDENNRILSEARAEAIAAYFNKHLNKDDRKIVVKYVGVGEKMTKTKDGVASPKDREVDYYLSSTPPFDLPKGPEGEDLAWKDFKGFREIPPL